MADRNPSFPLHCNRCQIFGFYLYVYYELSLDLRRSLRARVAGKGCLVSLDHLADAGLTEASMTRAGLSFCRKTSHEHLMPEFGRYYWGKFCINGAHIPKECRIISYCSRSNMASLYNSLPTVEDADEAFTNREALFENLAPLLASYGYEYGVILVHGHTTLDDDELMVEEGVCTSPVSNPEQVYGNKWLKSGEAYEFTNSKVPPPPPDLLKAFSDKVGDSPLGLFYAKDLMDNFQGKRGVERTIGRDNIIEWVDATTPLEDTGFYISTSWLPGQQGFPEGLCQVVTVCMGVNGRHLKTATGHQKAGPPRK